MEIERCLIEPPLGQGRNKEIKDFLQFNENKVTMYPNLCGKYESSTKRKVQSTECPHKDSGEIAHDFNSTPGTSRTKASRLTQEE